MLLELQPPVGQGGPVRLEVHQLVVRDRQGTPVAVALTYGPDQCIRVAHARDPEFSQLLRLLGLPPVEVQTLQLPPPPGGAKIWTPGS